MGRKLKRILERTRVPIGGIACVPLTLIFEEKTLCIKVVSISF